MTKTHKSEIEQMPSNTQQKSVWIFQILKKKYSQIGTSPPHQNLIISSVGVGKTHEDQKQKSKTKTYVQK